MNAVTYDIVQPHLIRRTGGGWLAVSPKHARFLIGVTGTTEDEARDKFNVAYMQWIELRDGPVL